MENKSFDVVSGAAVFWKTGRTRREILVAGLQSLGLDSYVPPERTPKAILHDALRALYQKPTVLVRPMKDKAAFTVIDEDRGTIDAGNQYGELLKASVDDEGKVSATRDEYRIQAAYEEHATQLPGTTVSAVLVNLLEARLNGIALRPKGAIYWLPQQSIKTWREVAEVVERASIDQGANAVYSMQTSTDANTIRAVKDGIIAELTQAVETLNHDLQHADLGERALQTRIDQCSDLHERLKVYEGIIGESLGELRQGIQDVGSAALTAQIVAAGQQGERANAA